MQKQLVTVVNDILLERTAVEKQQSEVVLVLDVRHGRPLVRPDRQDFLAHQALVDIDGLVGAHVLLLAAATIFVTLALFLFLFIFLCVCRDFFRGRRCRFLIATGLLTFFLLFILRVALGVISLVCQTE